MTDKNLEVTISVNDQLSAAVDKIASKLNSLEKVTDRIANSLNNFGDKMLQVGKAASVMSAGVTAGAAGIYKLAQSTAQVGDDVAKTADKLGVGVEALQEFGFAAQKSGVSQSTFEMALQRMTRRLAEAANGTGEAKDAIAELGLDAKALASGGPEAALNSIADAMANVESQSDRLRLGFKLFDSEGVAVINMLRDGSAGLDEMRQEARDTGNVLSEDVARSSEKFNDAMLSLQERMAGLKNTVGAELIPVFVNTLIPALETKVIPAIASVAKGIAGAVEWFASLSPAVQEAATVIAGAFAVGGPVLLAIGALSKALAALIAATGPIGLFIAAAGLLTAAWVQWGDDITAAISVGIEAVQTKFGEMVEWFRQLPAMFLQIGTDIVLGLRDGIVNKFEEVSEQIMQPFRDFGTGVKDFFGIKSPSKLFHGYGVNIVEGMRDGIANSAGMLGGAMEQVNGSVLGSLGALFDQTQKFAAAEALINAGRAAAQALADPAIPFWGKLAAAASMFAAGKRFADSIKSVSPSGGGGGNPTGGGQTQQQQPGQTIIVDMKGDTFSGPTVREVFNIINEGLRSGERIAGVVMR